MTLLLICVPADVDAPPLMSDLSAELLGLDVESWSLAASKEFCRPLDRRTTKRQDVIYGVTFLPNKEFHIRVIICACIFKDGIFTVSQT